MWIYWAFWVYCLIYGHLSILAKNKLSMKGQWLQCNVNWQFVEDLFSYQTHILWIFEIYSFLINWEFLFLSLVSSSTHIFDRYHMSPSFLAIVNIFWLISSTSRWVTWVHGSHPCTLVDTAWILSKPISTRSIWLIWLIMLISKGTGCFKCYFWLFEHLAWWAWAWWWACWLVLGISLLILQILKNPFYTNYI